MFINMGEYYFDGYCLWFLEIVIVFKYGNIVKFLLEKGVDVNLFGWIVLIFFYWFIFMKDEIIINYLL